MLSKKKKKIRQIFNKFQNTDILQIQSGHNTKNQKLISNIFLENLKDLNSSWVKEKYKPKIQSLC